MGYEKERVLKKRSAEAKALQKKQFRQQVIRNKKRGKRHERYDDLPGLRGEQDQSEREGHGYDGLGFAGSWSGGGGSDGSGGEGPSEE